MFRGDRLDVLEEVWEAHKQFGEWEFEQITKKPGAPWREARGHLPNAIRCHNILSKEDIGPFYGQKIGKALHRTPDPNRGTHGSAREPGPSCNA